MELDSQKTQTYFHQRARDFDSLYDEKNKLAYLFNRIFRNAMYQRVEMTIDEFEGLKDFTVLDVGCGSGRNSILFSKAGAKNVTGIDFAENMLDLARKYSRDADLSSQCEFIKHDVLTYVPPARFDVSVALGVFDYTADPRPLLQKMKDVTRVKVIGSFPERSFLRESQRKVRYSLKNCPVYFYSREQLGGACAEVGLRNVRIKPMSAGYLMVAEP